MTTFPGSPRLTKGAIVALDPSSNLVVSTIVFQYNPEKLERNLQVQAIDGESVAYTEALRLKGAPVETITLNNVEIDAGDQLEKAEKIAVNMGIYPQLSALETLLYPKSSRVTAYMQQAKMGSLEIIPLEAPMTMLVWGKQRVLPVRLTSFSINEEAYDVNLNPIRASVNLSLRVLSYNDLPWGQRGSQLFLVHQKIKEGMAKIGSLSNLPANTRIF